MVELPAIAYAQTIKKGFVNSVRLELKIRSAAVVAVVASSVVAAVVVAVVVVAVVGTCSITLTS